MIGYSLKAKTMHCHILRLDARTIVFRRSMVADDLDFSTYMAALLILRWEIALCRLELYSTWYISFNTSKRRTPVHITKKKLKQRVHQGSKSHQEVKEKKV